MQIGQWVKREGAFRRHRLDFEKWVGPRWHLVESVIEGAAITRCGRRMQPQQGPGLGSGNELQVSEMMPLTRMIGQPQLCKAGCDRVPLPAGTIEVSGTLTVTEDDASTHDELEP